MHRSLYFLLTFSILLSCSKDRQPIEPAMYFPSSTEWEYKDPISLQWNTTRIADLYDLLATNNTRGFIVLHKGKIVLENYWGNEIVGGKSFGQNSTWYWASAGKTLTASVAGIARDASYLQLNDKTSSYLGKGWSALSQAQEDSITLWHHLTMTTGLDDAVTNSDNTDAANLQYKAPAGSRWAYHNAPYTLLDTIIESAIQSEFEPYFNSVLRDPIGMDGQWLWLGDNHVYFSTARSMARFGHLMLNRGKWNSVQVIPALYTQEMVTPSQELNRSYGYLWWLNTGPNFMLPQSQIVFPGKICPNAPNDMYAGLGKNGQYVCVAPSLGLVVVRMGENPDNELVPILFLNDIWEILTDILP